MRKKIVLVTDAWKPQVNGGVRVIEALMQRLEARGYEVELIHPGFFMTVPLPLYPEIRLAVFPRNKVERLIRAAHPDAIHIMTEGPVGHAARAYCAQHQIPFTTWYHTHFQLYLDIRLKGLLALVTKFLRRFHAPATRTFVSTTSLGKSLTKEGFKHLVVVPLGVDTAFFVPTPSDVLRDSPRPIFGYLGRLAPEKSPEEFLKLDLPGTKVVIGNGPARSRLEHRYGATNTFVGYKRGKELVKWISACDVLVFPSRTETFGLVTLEALACGVPVVAHDVMGPRDIITNGFDGYLSDNLRDAALKALSLSSVQCRATAELYTWEACTDAFIRNLAWIQK